VRARSGSGLGGLLGGTGAAAQTPPTAPPTPPVAPGLPQGGLLGGLSGMLQSFQQSGHSDVLNSWIGPGQNQPIAPDQLHQALGPEAVDNLSRLTGIPQNELLSELSRVLPGVVDKLSPHGRMPDQAEHVPLVSRSNSRPVARFIVTAGYLEDTDQARREPGSLLTAVADPAVFRRAFAGAAIAWA